MESVQKTFDEMYSEVLKDQSGGENSEVVREELEQARWDYKTEMKELRHNFRKFFLHWFHNS